MVETAKSVLKKNYINQWFIIKFDRPLKYLYNIGIESRNLTNSQGDYMKPAVKQPIDISSFKGEITKLAPQARQSHQDTTVRATGYTNDRPASWKRLIKENS